jgi:hypothetical protein
MFEFKNYDADSDPFNDNLKKLLELTEVQRLGGEKGHYSTWDFLQSSESGAPFSLTIPSSTDDGISVPTSG